MKTRLTILALLVAAGMAGIVWHQTRWQLDGMKDPRMVRFLRRYDRGDASKKLPERARITDRSGNILSAPAGNWERTYPLGAAGVHPVGYFDRISGMTGCERVLDSELSTSPSPVKLSIDSRLQKKAYALLKGRPGAVVVMRPASGRILALVSSPGFDPNRPADAFALKNAPLLNRPLSGLYAPGSTFKLFVAATALSKGIDPVFPCPAGGYIAAANTPPIRDSEALAAERTGRKWRGWGNMGMDDALAHSSNVYFAQLAVALGATDFNEFALKSRLRDGVSVLRSGTQSLDSSSCGIPDVRHNAELAQPGIGQGSLMMTPIAVAMLTAAIANDGAIAEPTLSATAQPQLRARPFTAAAANRVKKAMRLAVKKGTAKACDLHGLDVCAKTGTAQNGSSSDHAWFTCFAPEKNPKVVVTVLVEHGGFGADSALPIAKSLLLECKADGLL